MAQTRIAEAYVQIVPTADNVSDVIAKEMSKGFEEGSKAADPVVTEQAEETGTKSGKGMGKALAAGIVASGLGAILAKNFSAAIEDAIASQDADIKLKARFNLDEESSENASEAIDELFKGGYRASRDEVSETMASIVGTVKGAREASAEELEKMGRDALNLTSLFEDADMGAVTKAANVMISTGMATDWDDAISQITGGFQTMGEFGDDWLDTLGEFSADFKTFGLEGDDAINFVNAALEGGVRNTDAIANGLNEMQIALGDKSRDEELISLGLEPDKIRQQVAEGGDVAQAALLDIMDKIQQSGNRDLWQKFMASYGEDFAEEWQNMDLEKVNAELEEGVGNMQEVDDLMSGTMSASIQELKNTWSQALADTVTPLLVAITPLLVSLAGWVSENSWVIGALAVVLGGVFVVAMVMSTLALWNMAAAGAAASIGLGPIILIVLAVIAGIIILVATIYLLWTNWDTIWGWIKETASGFGDWFVGLWEGITGWFTDAWNGVGDFFVGLWEGLRDFFVGIYESIMNMIEDMIERLQKVRDEAKKGADTVADSNSGPLSNVTKLFGFGNKEKKNNGRNAWGGINVPMMADGGTIPARSGGTLALLGEGGRSEVVMDSGKWNNMLDNINSGAVGSGGEKNVTFNITQRENESTEELVNRINEHLDFTGLRG